MNAADAWLATLERDAPDVVACWHALDNSFSGLKALRRELRDRVHEGDTPRILAQQEVLGDALERVLLAMPERLLRAPGGEEDWNVAQAFAHTTAARRFLGTWAALDAGGEWPKEHAPVVTPSVPGRPDATRDELLVLLDKSRRAIRESAARISGHERQRCGMDHPLIGHLRCGEWLLFLGIHDCMHLEQLHRLLETDAAAGPAACLSVPRRSCSLRRRPRASPLAPTPRWRPRASGCWRPSCRTGSGGIGAAVAPLPFEEPPEGESFHWGRWFVAGARRALGEGGAVDAIGYAGAGALALLDDGGLEALLSPIPGEVVANNRFSADAFVVAGDLDRALTVLEDVESDNGAPRALNDAGWEWRDLGATPWARFDVDTTLDLSLLRLATRLDGTRALDGSVRGFLEMARLPGDRPLEVPNLDEIGAVIRDRSAELVVAGRVPTTTWQMLETETACRVRGLVEERGMRSARSGQVPRSILAALMDRSTPTRAGRGAGSAGGRGRARHARAHGGGGGLAPRRRPGLPRRSASPRTSATRPGSPPRGCGSWSRLRRAHRSRSCSAGMPW